MNFNKHYRQKGEHAFLSPSNYHWLNYSDDKLIDTYINRMIMPARGTRFHAFAAEAITLNEYLRNTKRTIPMFVNDGIKYKMSAEETLYYSDNCFGTADAISFDEKKKLLRIHDLKTGTIPANMTQLRIYAALFCLEYDYEPTDISIELRIYQNDEIVIENPNPDDINTIINKIISYDILIENVKKREDLI